MRRTLTLISTLFFGMSSVALADSARTILVLDGSGSMWGQIGNKHKIEIARDVINQVIDDIPTERELGLVAYGHNRKGDCTDIEALSEIGTGRDVIRDAIASINPKGKTPLSDAVTFAANELRYTEEAATVILISDGIETCNADPCAVGKVLEETGVDFTAHVVGFDVSEPEALKQLQCLAENTGGQFFSASNAGELTQALQETVVAAPEPEPEPLPTLYLTATENEGGPTIKSGLEWVIRQAGGGDEVFTATGAGETSTEIAKGIYDIAVTDIDSGLSASAELVSIKDREEYLTIAIDMTFPASVRTVPEGEIPVGSDFVVYWEGPARQGDYVTIVPEGADAGDYLSYAYHTDGQPLKLTASVKPGGYEVRYILDDPTTVMASVPVTLTDVAANLEAADQVAAGASFPVSWDGPDYDGDWITVVKPDAGPTAYESYLYPTTETSELTASIEPGQYELRYVLKGERVIATRPIEVVEVSATLDAPVTVDAGSEFKVTWKGPGEQGDWVTIVPPDAKGNSYQSYFYPQNETDIGELTAPLEAGTYELRYVQAGEKILTSVSIEVVPVSVNLNAPSETTTGANIEVSWEGPGDQGDYIVFAKPGAEPESGAPYTYLNDSNLAEIKAPLDPGAYEIVYLHHGKKELARVPVSVTELVARLSAPDSGTAGALLPVEWVGPNTESDYLSVARPDAPYNKYETYIYTRDDNSGEIKLPVEPGNYELRYIQGGEKQIAMRTIIVKDVSATLDAPPTAEAGATLMIGWVGPQTNGDYITVARLDAAHNKYESYFYTDDSPGELLMPTEPGEYELRYIQSGAKILTAQPITISDVTADISVPAEILAGAKMKLDWSGPAAKRDLVTIAALDARPSKYEDYFYATSDGESLLTMPVKPGSYELRYVLNGQRVIFAKTVDVLPVTASLDAADQVIAEATLMVTFGGPMQDNDYVTIARSNAKPSKYETYSYLHQGDLVELRAPKEPGEYELRYIQRGEKILARQPLTVIAGE